MTGGAPNPPFFFHTGLTSGLTYGLEGLWRLAQYSEFMFISHESGHCQKESQVYSTEVLLYRPVRSRNL